MTTLAHAQAAGVNAKRVTVGSVCKVAAVAAIVSMISVFSADRLSRAHVATADITQQTELRDLLCRIDRRCADVGVVARLSGRGMMCRIDRRCPTVYETARVQAAEVAVR
jgi:hypothetical protein